MQINIRKLSIPHGITLDIVESSIIIKGPLGKIVTPVNKIDPYGIIFIRITSEGLSPNQTLEISGNYSHSKYKSLFPSVLSKIEQLIDGVSRGVFNSLELVGVGYRAQLESSFLDLKLGYSHPVQYSLNSSIKIVQKKPTEIALYGIDRQYVGQTAANLRAFRPPEIYKGKGIRYQNELIRLKQGKKK